MADARGTTLTLRISGTAGTGEDCTFSASGRTIVFAGFLKAYVESVDEEAGGQSDDAESSFRCWSRVRKSRPPSSIRTGTAPTRPLATQKPA